MAGIITKEDEAHPSHPNYPVNVAKREALAGKKLADEKAAAEKAEAEKLNKK